MAGSVGKGPGEDDGGNTLVDGEDEVDGQKFVLVGVSSGKLVQGDSGSEGEERYNEEDRGLVLGLGDGKRGDEVGNDTDRTGNHWGSAICHRA